MKFVRCRLDGGVSWGVQESEQVHLLGDSRVGAPSLQDLLNPSYRRVTQDLLSAQELPRVDLEAIDRLAPVTDIGKIVCIGLNYHDHAAEQDQEIPEQPILFAKASTSVTDPGAPIVKPPDIDQLDYEVELGVVIGRTAKAVAAGEARDYIAGYTVVHDVSARDAQFADGQWFRGKSYDTFAPMGPNLVSENDIEPNDLEVELSVNGNRKQQSTTAEFIFNVDELVEYISRAMTLRPGDVISTGTPGGVGVFREPPDLLEPGDVVEAEIEDIGVLRNRVVGSDG
jgi:2-keto-4-pentenoate hydratase/2-oxohepta-3-ene-1,7-dioic acid hydratase in catechol pathway